MPSVHRLGQVPAGVAIERRGIAAEAAAAAWTGGGIDERLQVRLIAAAQPCFLIVRITCLQVGQCLGHGRFDLAAGQCGRCG